MGNRDRKIVWAVDPFSDEPALQKSAITALERFVAKEDVEIYPVFVWETSIGGALKAKEYENLRSEGQMAVDRLIGEKKMNVQPLAILDEGFSSIKAKAEAVIQFTKELNAELIVLSTHSRRIPKAWVLGSFAETLSLISETPLLIAHLRWRPTPVNRKAVLFATDFSDRSLAAFEKLVEMAKKADWSITIFHRVRAPVYPGYELAFTAWSAYEAVFKEEIRENAVEAARLAEMAKRRGVRASILIDKMQSGDVTSGILQALKRPYLMVALAAQSGVFARTLLGSTTRSLIRESPVPVWVMHPVVKSKAESLKAKGRPKPKAPSPRSQEPNHRMLF